MALEPTESDRRKLLRQVLLGLGGVAILALLLASVLLFPTYVIENDLGNKVKELRADQLAKAKSDIRTSLLQTIGGVALALGAIATWRQLRLTRLQFRLAQEQANENQKHNQEQLVIMRDQMSQTEKGHEEELRLTREAQINDRFTRAIDQLGSDELDIRLGGLYALQRIAQDSGPDRRTIAQVLAAYIRQHSPWPPSLPGQYTAAAPLHKIPDLEIRASDVQAAISILGKKMFAEIDDIRRLIHVDLRRADFIDLDYQDAHFSDSNLSWASLHSANLKDTAFMACDLSQASLYDTHFERSRMSWTNLKGASLTDSDFRGAELFVVNLEEVEDIDRADLRGVTADADTKWPEGFDPSPAGIKIETD
jgi:hypothetical protein